MPHATETAGRSSTSRWAASRSCGWLPGGRRRARGVALVFNLVVLPRSRDATLSPGERQRGVRSGIVSTRSRCCCCLLFPHRPDIAAAAWGILAVGDGWRRSRPALGGALCRGTATRHERARSRSSCSAALAARCSPGGAGRTCRPIAGSRFARRLSPRSSPRSSRRSRSSSTTTVGAASAASALDRCARHEDLLRPRWRRSRMAAPAAAPSTPSSPGPAMRRNVTSAGAIAGVIGIAISVATGWPGWICSWRRSSPRRSLRDSA